MRKLLAFGNWVSGVVANAAGHPLAQLIIVVFCAAWFIIGGPSAENTLTLALSVLAITLTQMVLNQQKRSEKALHLKIDELIFSMKGARNEMAAIEGLSEEELRRLRSLQTLRFAGAAVFRVGTVFGIGYARRSISIRIGAEPLPVAV